jgi:hypothetical protein
MLVGLDDSFLYDVDSAHATIKLEKRHETEMDGGQKTRGLLPPS